MTWLPWMSAEPADGWYSESQLAEQQRAEEEEREFRVMLRRRREFELLYHEIERERGHVSDEQRRWAWQHAEAIARGEQR
jgi:adenylyl- and sulfurtransferase ThiI